MRHLLRKAGELDERYAKAIDNRFGYSKGKGGVVGGLAGLTSAVPIKDVFNRPGNNPEGVKEHLINAAMEGGVAGANIAARYALPAGGVTLAGVALYDMTQQLMGNQQSTGAVMP